MKLALLLAVANAATLKSESKTELAAETKAALASRATLRAKGRAHKKHSLAQTEGKTRLQMRDQARAHARESGGEGQYDPWEMCEDCDWYGDCHYYPECAEGWEDEAAAYWDAYYAYGDEWEATDLDSVDFCADCEYFGDCGDFNCY